jgi:ATP-dependent helicase HrpA
VLAPALADVREQFSGLIYPGFVAKTGTGRLPDLIRYLRAIGKRLEKMPDDPGRDADRMAIVHQVTADYRQTLASLPAGARDGADARILRWMIEELRVSLFAQTVGTPVPVSEQRIGRQLDRLIASS